MAASVEVAGLEHAYDAHTVVRGLSFSLAPGGIGCLLATGWVALTTPGLRRYSHDATTAPPT